MSCLSIGMDAGIGSSCTCDRGFAFEKDLQGIFDESLDGCGIGLCLPPAVVCAVVGYEEFICVH